MTRYSKYIVTGILAILGLAVLAPAASARPFIVRGYFGPWYGPAYYGGWYGPAYYGPYAYGYAYPAPNVGKIKFETRFPLRPGTHNIELRDTAGQAIFQQKVDVVVGKTIKLAA